MNSNEFRVLGALQTVADKPWSEVKQQILRNINIDRAWIHELSVWNTPKDLPIALVGGGPSLKDHLHDLRNFMGVIVACGSVHDYLVENKVTAHYCVLADPDAVVCNYIKKFCGHTYYLVATQCHPSVFEQLKYVAVAKWNCFNDNHEEFKSIAPNFQAIGGGCTVGLRALAIAILMGYKDIHLFGFDSSLGSDDRHHAYDFSSQDETLGKIYEVTLDPEKGKVYQCAGYHIAQAQNFIDFYSKHPSVFNPVFHGDGYLPELFNKTVEGMSK